MGLVLNIIGYEKKIVYLFTTYKKMAKQSTQNVSNYSYNVISNRENLDEKKKAIIDGVKIELFNTMNLDQMMVNRNEFAGEISKNRQKSTTPAWVPSWEIEIKGWIKINLWDKKYVDIKQEYEDLIRNTQTKEEDLKKLDLKLAQRLILDSWLAIEFKWKNAQEVSQLEYNELNKLDEYKWAIELVSKKIRKTNYFVIKWNEEQKEKIKSTMAIINAMSNVYDPIIEHLQKTNKEQGEQLKDKSWEIEKLKKRLNSDDEENEKKNETSKKVEDFYPWLEWKDNDAQKNKEMKEKNRESLEKNPLFVSRKDVEKSIFKSRENSEFPVGNIEIKWTYVKIEEFNFYQELKQEYILAKWDSVKLTELDKKLAELLILSLPKWVAVEQRYQIRLTEEEIIAGGLVVDTAFLAKYGIAIDYFEYTNTTIEREYQERLGTIRKIETEITELTTVITELTRRVTVENTSNEAFILEIKNKKEKVKLLKEKLYALLISLKETWNEKTDEAILALKAREKQLQEEWDELKKQKEYQERVNDRIKELEEGENHNSFNELRRLYEERLLLKKSLNETLNTEESTLAKELENPEKIKSDLKKINKILQKATDGALRDIKKSDFQSPITQQKYEELDNLMKQQSRGKYSRSTLFQELWDYLEGILSWKNSIGKGNKASERIKRDIADINKKIEEKISSCKKWKEIEDALDSIPKWMKQSIYIVTKDWKKCWLQKGRDFYIIMRNPTDLFENISSVTKEELLIWLDPDKVEKIVIWEKNISETEIVISNNQAEKNELAKLKTEQEGFDKNIDKKIADKEKELADIRNRIKDSIDARRIVIEGFDDSDKWVYFHDFTEKNWIKRKDWKKIQKIWGMDIDAIYVDKDGRELKLEPKEWANDDWYDNPITKYELVYYEQSETTEWISDIEKQLLIIIHEQEELEAELERLETKLQTERSESIKIIIEEQIKIIQQKLLIIKQSISNIINYIKIYRETIRKDRYAIIKVREVVIPNPTPVDYNMNAVISDMWTDVFKEKATLKVEEWLKQDYKNTAWRNMPKRLALFLWRGKRRKKLIKQEMQSMQNTAFQRNAEYAELNEQSQHAADRHAFERMNNLAYGKWGSVVNSLTTVHNAQIDQLCKDYLTQMPPMTDEYFQDQFNTIVAADTNITTALSNNKITHIWTNILLTLQQEKASEKLMEDVLTELNTSNPSQWRMNNLIETYIKDFQTNPNFLTVYQNYLNNSIDTIQLKNHLIHQQAAMKMRVANLKMNIDIVNKGKSAYQIENSDREKWKWSWKFKLWNWMDKHPRLTTAGSLWISVWLWLATAWLWAVAWAAVTTAGFAGLVWTTNAVKKWTHHTKEQNTHEKNRVTDYRNEQRKIQEWQNQALNGRWWKKYKAKRQLALYDQTTQENIKLSNQITEILTNLSSKTTQLTTNELQAMHWSLIEWWARLKYYQETGHNFLASESVDQTEKDMKRLEKAIYLWLNKVWKNTSDIENNSIVFTDTLWNNITYSVLKNDLKESYDKSLVQFKRERRNLSLKYWIGTAVASAGMALGMQYLLWTWVFAKDTPAIAWSTTSHTWWTDNFKLWEHNITNGNVYAQTSSAVSSWAPTWSSIHYTYWIWTDWTGVIKWSLTWNDLTDKIKEVTNNINSMSGLSAKQKGDAIAELGRLKYVGFTNDNLATMRAAENIEHFAQAI